MLVILYELRLILLKARAKNLQLVHQSLSNVDTYLYLQYVEARRYSEEEEESVLYNVILD